MALETIGSNPIFHPIGNSAEAQRRLGGVFLIKLHIGVSSSGKTQHFDCCIRRFESCHPCHVVADYVSFATTFLLKSHRLTHAVAPPFRKKSRSAHLLGCKRPRNGLLSLPTFCGFKSKSVFRYGIFFATSSQLIRLENVSFGSFLALGTSKWKEHFLYWFSRLFSSICARNPADASCAAGFLGRLNHGHSPWFSCVQK